MIEFNGSYSEEYLEFLENLFMRAGFSVGDDTSLKDGILKIETLDPNDQWLLDKAKFYLM